MFNFLFRRKQRLLCIECYCMFIGRLSKRTVCKFCGSKGKSYKYNVDAGNFIPGDLIDDSEDNNNRQDP